MNTRFSPRLLAAALTASSTLAFAHGNDEHVKSPRYDATKIEPTEFGQQGDA